VLHGFFGSHDRPINHKVKPSGWLMQFLSRKKEPVKKKHGKEKLAEAVMEW
jgi:hypothetical protein